MGINIGSLVQGGLLSIIPLIVPNSGDLINQVQDDIKNGVTPEKIKLTVHDAIKLAENYTPDKIDTVLEKFDAFFDAGVDLEQAIEAAAK